jgi:Zn-dependent protease with chaperone function
MLLLLSLYGLLLTFFYGVPGQVGLGLTLLMQLVCFTAANWKDVRELNNTSLDHAARFPLMGIYRIVEDLCRDLGIDPHKVEVVNGYNNAGIHKHKMYLGTKLIDRLTPIEIRGIMAHEQGHLKTGKRTSVKAILALATICGSVILVLFVFGFSSWDAIGSILNYFTLPMALALFTVMRWKLEYAADASTVGTRYGNDLKKALETFQKLGLDKEYCFTHPCIRSRIARLNSLLPRDTHSSDTQEPVNL